MRIASIVAGFGLLLTTHGAQAEQSAASLNQRLLAAHNAERARFGASALAWDDGLAKDAQAWADHLAKTQTFDHAKQAAQGENLWMGSAGQYSPEDMVEGWVEEKQYFKSGVFPDVSTTGNWSDVGHYTQLVWKTTTNVGCAIASGGGDDYLVCRYNPPGNWTGTRI